MAGKWCRNPVAVRSFTPSTVTVEIGERGFVAVDCHGDELRGARLLRKLAPAINLMELSVNGRPLMQTEMLEQGLVDLALGAREVAR